MVVFKDYWGIWKLKEERDLTGNERDRVKFFFRGIVSMMRKIDKSLEAKISEETELVIAQFWSPELIRAHSTSYPYVGPVGNIPASPDEGKPLPFASMHVWPAKNSSLGFYEGFDFGTGYAEKKKVFVKDAGVPFNPGPYYEQPHELDNRGNVALWEETPNPWSTRFEGLMRLYYTQFY